MKKSIALLSILFLTANAYSQDTLPKFTIIERGDRVVVSWVNPLPNVIQLNVQRSYDSLRNFVTVFSPTSPALEQNGYTEKKISANRVYYRLFYVVEGGDYFFTRSKRASGTAPDLYNRPDVLGARDNTSSLKVDASETKLVTIKIKDTIYRQVAGSAFRSFRDSILRQTKDTLFALNDSLVVLNPYIVKEVWRASNYIFVNKDGYINISLPKVEERKYHVKFFEENGNSLFEVNHVRESPLILDKSIFIHSGWFLFELYEDTKLKEKNKFYLPKDF